MMLTPRRWCRMYAPSVVGVRSRVDDADRRSDEVAGPARVVLDDETAIGVDAPAAALADGVSGARLQPMAPQRVARLPGQPHGVGPPRHERVVPLLQTPQQRGGEHVAVNVVAERLPQ